MSTRWYPLYQRGNPQLRICLPNFWLKLVRPEINQPKNVVTFHCSMQMTKYDVENYLKDIYKVPVVEVRTRIGMGEFYQDHYKRYIKKKDDIKFAYVTLPNDMTFEFPNIFPDKKEKEEMDKADEQIDQMKGKFNEYVDKNKKRPGLPGWFSI